MAKLSRCNHGGKVCYENQDQAIKRALISSRKRGVALRPYYHQACGYWHLTRMREYAPALDIRNRKAS